MSPSFPHPDILASSIDGRAHNPFYRQTQLYSLHKTIQSNINEIQEAIASDTSNSTAEIAVDISLTIAAIRNDYTSLQPAKSLEDEYLIAHGKDSPLARRPVGIVYIEAETEHTPLYSAVVPLSAAIAAGNCVVLLLENNIRRFPALLKRILLDALDEDTFAIAASPIKDPRHLEQIVSVRQSSQDAFPKSNEINSLPHKRTVAVVDRTANLKLAAQELVAARFSFQGKSPYAPDVVLVNEFVKKDFLDAVVSECEELNLAASKIKNQTEALEKSSFQVVFQQDHFAVLDLTTRDEVTLAAKRTGRTLIVHEIRSLDDAIDLIGKGSSPLAAYYFSNPESGKYLSQFVDAGVSFVNHIPRDILLGPAFPASLPIDPTLRYPSSLFETPCPAFINPPSRSATVAAALTSSGSPIELLAEAKVPLKEMKRSTGGNVGFFEQGFLINAGLILTTVVCASSVGVYWMMRYRRDM